MLTFIRGMWTIICKELAIDHRRLREVLKRMFIRKLLAIKVLPLMSITPRKPSSASSSDFLALGI